MLVRGQRFDLVVYVPQQHAVQARTIDGGIDSRGLKSDLDLRTDSGAVAVAIASEGSFWKPPTVSREAAR